MAKKHLFSIKTNKGYGLFQEYESYPNAFDHNFYVVYYTQISSLTEKKIEKAMEGEYYYSRVLLLSCLGYGISEELLLKNPGKEIYAESLRLQEGIPFGGPCKVTYLGDYELPADVEIPKYSRELELSYFTGKFKWYIHNEVENKPVVNARNKRVSYNRLNDEIKSYPQKSVLGLMGLLKNFNTDYRQINADQQVLNAIEEKYHDFPALRPTNLKFDDIKYPFPSAEMKTMIKEIKGDKEREEYESFCEKIEELCKTFIGCIENNKKLIKKHLIVIINGLNQLETETGLINSIEAEILYDYLSNVLKSLRRVSLIEEIEERRNW